jgi:hypothetical protein
VTYEVDAHLLFRPMPVILAFLQVKERGEHTSKPTFGPWDSIVMICAVSIDEAGYLGRSFVSSGRVADGVMGGEVDEEEHDSYDIHKGHKLLLTSETGQSESTIYTTSRSFSILILVLVLLPPASTWGSLSSTLALFLPFPFSLSRPAFSKRSMASLMVNSLLRWSDTLCSAHLVFLDLPQPGFFLFQRLVIIQMFKLRGRRDHSWDTWPSNCICIDNGLPILLMVATVGIARVRSHRLVSRIIGFSGCSNVGFSILLRCVLRA